MSRTNYEHETNKVYIPEDNFKRKGHKQELQVSPVPDSKYCLETLYIAK